MRKRPITTLFMLMSVDGKISTGASDNLDVDKDFPIINCTKAGLHQYYEIERTTDLWSVNSGRVMAKIGVNDKPLPNKRDVSFVIIDNSHLSVHGVEYFSKLAKTFVLVTSNKSHPAYSLAIDNVNFIYQESFDPVDMLEHLYDKFGCERITIQTGGTLNGLFLRVKTFDFIDIIVAPVLIGGKDTSTLIDGSSLLLPNELNKVGELKLESCDMLLDSYVRLRYKVIG